MDQNLFGSWSEPDTVTASPKFRSKKFGQVEKAGNVNQKRNDRTKRESNVESMHGRRDLVL